MEAKTVKRIETGTIIVILIFLMVMIGIYISRHFFEFKNSEVQNLIDEEVKKYPAEAQSAISGVLHDTCMYLLSDRHIVSGLRARAKATGLPKEKILVDTAIAQATAWKYIS